MYTIEVSYIKGDSYGSTSVDNEPIGLCWESKDLARKALQHIKEHYSLVRQYEKIRHAKDYAQFNKNAKKSDWFRLDETDVITSYDNAPESWKYNCRALMDDGTYRKIPTSMWVGYFESLKSARVVCERDDEDMVTF